MCRWRSETQDKIQNNNDDHGDNDYNNNWQINRISKNHILNYRIKVQKENLSRTPKEDRDKISLIWSHQCKDNPPFFTCIEQTFLSNHGSKTSWYEGATGHCESELIDLIGKEGGGWGQGQHETSKELVL